MDSIGATVYTMRGEGSSDCTLMRALPCETSDCTAPILGVVSIAQRLQWILAHRTREDGSPWKPTPLSLVAGLRSEFSGLHEIDIRRSAIA